MSRATMDIKDAVEVDPLHYAVEFENEHVRAIRINYGPHDKSVMHSHKAAAIVFLTDHKVKFTYPDGSSEVSDAKAGELRWLPAVEHLPENLGDEPLEVILIEPKG